MTSLKLGGIAASLALVLAAPDTAMAQANTNYGVNTLTVNQGNDNSAFGYGALQFNVNGFRNTGLGQGALYSNVNGFQNTAIGSLALVYNTEGSENTAVGLGALLSNTTGFGNTATGSHALGGNRSGNNNTASGFLALNQNTGEANTASGANSLIANSDGWGNTAAGYRALDSNVSGYSNIAVGYLAGTNTLGNENIMIGHQGDAGDNQTLRIGQFQNRTFIAGITGRQSTRGVQVYINAWGQLGTQTSSRRFKQDIHSIDAVSDKLLQLRPVSFRYTEAAAKGDRSLEYGLIAEEVAEVLPELVQYDQEGKPFTVYYHLLTPLLLAEVQKAHELNRSQQVKLDAQQAQLTGMRTEMLALLKQQQEQHVAEMAALQERLAKLDAVVSTERVASISAR